jgi:hypothetical protein
MRCRRDLVVAALGKAGIETCVPEATFYVWASVPKGFTSSSFTIHVMEKTGVVVTPGTGFGEHGEGYFRISLTCPDERLQEANGTGSKQNYESRSFWALAPTSATDWKIANARSISLHTHTEIEVVKESNCMSLQQ